MIHNEYDPFNPESYKKLEDLNKEGLYYRNQIVNLFPDLGLTNYKLSKLIAFKNIPCRGITKIQGGHSAKHKDGLKLYAIADIREALEDLTFDERKVFIGIAVNNYTPASAIREVYLGKIKSNLENLDKSEN